MAADQNKSILQTIKKLLGIDQDYDVFDPEIIVHINSAFSTLHQLGVGPAQAFSINGGSELWSAFVGDRLDINSAQTYIYLKVRLVFDPPTSSFVITAFENQAKELEWRLNVAVDPGNPTT